MKLKDQVAIVTGAASGIGAASARLFAAEGARLVLVDQDTVGLGQVAADIEARGGRALTIPADVSSDQQAREGVAKGSIVMTHRSGWKLKDQLIRSAQVVVAR